MTDANLAIFADCRDLRLADSTGCDVGDAGVAHLAGGRLRSLAVGGPRFTDAGLAHPTGHAEMKSLFVATRVESDP